MTGKENTGANPGMLRKFPFHAAARGRKVPSMVMDTPDRSAISAEQLARLAEKIARARRLVPLIHPDRQGAVESLCDRLERIRSILAARRPPPAPAE